MLEQFQAVYPQGRLISELVTIYHGKFIVRTLIQMGGEILASGLAAGDTVEMAEDLARVRSLHNLGLSNIQNQHEVINQVNHQTDLTILPGAVTPINPSVDKNLAVKSVSLHGTSEQPVSQSPAELTQPHLVVEPKAPEAYGINTIKQEKAQETNKIETPDIPLISNINASDISLTQTLTSQAELAIPTVSESGMTSLNIPATPPIQANQDNHEFGEDAWLYTDYTKKTEETVKPALSETTQPVINHDQILTEKSHIEIPTDLSDVHVKLDILLDRLAWDKERESEFLEETYQERSRSMLPDEKLVDFANYLEVLCQVVEELKRQGWKASQEKDYLEYNWQGRAREELTQSELENMYAYLQVFEQTTFDIKRLNWSAEQGKKYLLEKYAQQGRARLTYEQLLDFQEYLATQ